VVVQNGETLALGGIIQESRQLSKNRVPLLGDIPYIGALFGTTSLNTQRTELIILLTPTVIRNLSEAQAATAELRDRLKDLRGTLEDDERKVKEHEKANKAKSQSSVIPDNPSEERRN
jgi:general secretion pathway protein D